MRILVIGFYGKSNIGDDLFASAFQKLFPKYEFKFISQLTEKSLDNIDAVFIGGGSFLERDLSASPKAIAALKTKKLMYIGVGAETNISPLHTELMKVAKLIAIRSPEQLAKIKTLNENTIVIPDIVYSLQDNVVQSKKIEKSVLILPNIEVVPNHEDPHWKYSSFEYFKSEFSQFLDVIVNEGYKINFFTMCQNATMNDAWAASAIISMMKKRSNGYQLNYINGTIEELTEVMSKYSFIITQRYHGIVLSEMMGTPYISIHHHDKLKFAAPMRGLSHSYYGLVKSELLNSFNTLKSLPSLPIETNIFDTLKARVNEIVNGS